MPETNLLDPPKIANAKVPVVVGPWEHTNAQAPVLGAVVRLCWMLVGNAALYLSAVAITLRGPERAWTPDAAFWGTVASLVIVRYMDITRLRGATACGKPASFGDWRRYTCGLFSVSLTVWILAHAVAWIVSG